MKGTDSKDISCRPPGARCVDGTDTVPYGAPMETNSTGPFVGTSSRPTTGHMTGTGVVHTQYRDYDGRSNPLLRYIPAR